MPNSPIHLDVSRPEASALFNLLSLAVAQPNVSPAEVFNGYELNAVGRVVTKLAGQLHVAPPRVLTER